MPALTSAYRMVKLKKAFQGSRLAYLYTCSWPEQRHDEADALRKAVEELAHNSFTTLDGKKLHITFDTDQSVVHIVTGHYPKARPLQKFADGLKRLCSYEDVACTCHINHCGQGDSLAFDVGPFACLVQRLKDRNLVKTVTDDGVQFKPRPGWNPSATKSLSWNDTFFEKLAKEYLPQLQREASGMKAPVKRKRAIF